MIAGKFLLFLLLCSEGYGASKQKHAKRAAPDCARACLLTGLLGGCDGRVGKFIQRKRKTCLKHMPDLNARYIPMSFYITKDPHVPEPEPVISEVAAKKCKKQHAGNMRNQERNS